MNILLTGATGFIGTSFIKSVSGEHRIHCLVREYTQKVLELSKYPGVEIVKSTIIEMHNNELLSNLEFDIVYHFAWSGIRGSHRNEESTQIANYGDSMHIAKFVVEKKIKRLVMIGSQEEFDSINLIDHNTQPNPLTKYGFYKNKVHRDVLLLSKSHKFDFFWLRVFSVFGSGDYEFSLIQDTIKKMKKNEVVKLNYGSRKWDFLFIDDLIEALILAMKSNARPDTYNIAYGESKFLLEYIYIIKDKMNSQSEICTMDISFNGGISVNIDFTRENLHWNPQVSFEMGIDKILKSEVI